MRNILLIVTDQQRFDSLSCYGCTAIKTPNLDKLASQGARFTNCYVDNPVCTPSRASMFTGKPIMGHGVYRLHDDLPTSETPFPAHLREAGFETALYGKLHLSSRVFEDENRHPRDGFEIYEESKSPYLPPSKLNAYLPWLESNFPGIYKRLRDKGRRFGSFPEEAHLSRWVSSRTIDFLEKHDRSRPFFCYASFFDPHDPYNDYPESAANLVKREGLRSPVPAPTDWRTVPAGVLREHRHGYLGSMEAYSTEQIEAMRIGYYASVAFMDREVGRILDTLDELGYGDDTLVVFTSDHGDMLGDHGLLAKGAFFYEPCVKVPLIVRAPGQIAPQTVCNSLVQGHDLAATVLQAAGITDEAVFEHMPDSHDLLAAAAAGPGSGPVGGTNVGTGAADAAICLYRGTSICDTKQYFDPPINAGMYRWDRYKLNLYFAEHDAGDHPAGQLFDLDADPLEQNDLWSSDAHREVKLDLILRFTSQVNEMDRKYNTSRGGQHFPPQSHWSVNNPL